MGAGLCAAQRRSGADCGLSSRHWLCARRAPKPKTWQDRYFFETAVRLHRRAKGHPTRTDTRSGLRSGVSRRRNGSLESNSSCPTSRGLINKATSEGIAAQYKHVLASAREGYSRGQGAKRLREQAESELLLKSMWMGFYKAALGMWPTPKGATTLPVTAFTTGTHTSGMH